MKLLTKGLKEKLIANGRIRAGASDVKPVVKFFNPCGAATWLFTELDADGDTLFGLCDLGMGYPEMGYASLAEISAVKLRFGLKIERDMHFTAKMSLQEYADDASAKGRIDA
jgi:hypothetical protein